MLMNLLNIAQKRKKLMYITNEKWKYNMQFSWHDLSCSVVFKHRDPQTTILQWRQISINENLLFRKHKRSPHKDNFISKSLKTPALANTLTKTLKYGLKKRFVVKINIKCNQYICVHFCRVHQTMNWMHTYALEHATTSMIREVCCALS